MPNKIWCSICSATFHKSSDKTWKIPCLTGQVKRAKKYDVAMCSCSITMLGEGSYFRRHLQLAVHMQKKKKGQHKSLLTVGTITVTNVLGRSRPLQAVQFGPQLWYSRTRWGKKKKTPLWSFKCGSSTCSQPKLPHHAAIPKFPQIKYIYQLFFSPTSFCNSCSVQAQLK